jgi:hypothetical protein
MARTSVATTTLSPALRLLLLLGCISFASAAGRGLTSDILDVPSAADSSVTNMWPEVGWSFLRVGLFSYFFASCTLAKYG